MLQIGKPPAGSRSKGPLLFAFCIRQLRDSASGTPVGAKTAAGGSRPSPAWSPPRVLGNGKRETGEGRRGPRERRERRAAGSQRVEPSSRRTRPRASAPTQSYTTQGHRGTLFPCLCLALAFAFASPSRLSFPLALRLLQLEPLPSTHHLTSLPSLLLLLLVPSRQERRAPSRASGRNARAEALAPVVRLARPRRPRRGSSWRRRGPLRRGRPAVAEADAERSGGAGRRAAAGQGPAPRYYWAFDDARPADSGHLLAMRVRIARCCLCMGVAERVLV